MKFDYYKKHINWKTKGRCDVSGLFENPTVFKNLIKDLDGMFKDYDKIVGLDALGFILGSALAYKKGKPLVLIRKKGKFPGRELDKVEFVDYTGKKKGFEINKASIKKGDKVFLVDEWIETGSQVKSAIKLIENSGGVVIGIGSVCMQKNDKTKTLIEKYNCKSLRKF